MVIHETPLHREHVRDGKGKIDFFHVLDDSRKDDHVRMFAKLVFEPGASIGRHQHVGETEPYYIVSGEGLFTDNDGTQTVVRAGDICLIENMHYHGIENLSDTEELVLMALIYKQD